MLKYLGKAGAVFSKAEIKMRVQSQQCVSLRHKSSKCDRCVVHCPSEAIQVGPVGGTITVDWKECFACGICSSVCPTDVFQMMNFDEQSFLQQCLDMAQAGRKVTIFCRQVGIASSQNGTMVPCLGNMNVEQLMLLGAAAVQTVHFKCSDCSECRNKKGLSVLKQNLEEVNLLLSAFGDGDPMTCYFDTDTTASHRKVKKSGLGHQSPPEELVSRRFFFKQVTHKSRKTATQTLHQFLPAESGNGQKENALTKKLPPSRALLIAAIVNLKESGIRQQDLSGSRRLALLQIDAAKCDRCGVCHLFCPTGALKQVSGVEGNGAKSDFGVEFKSLNCVKCDLCVTGCASGAITYHDEVMSESVFSGETQRLISWSEPPLRPKKFDLNRILPNQAMSQKSL